MGTMEPSDQDSGIHPESKTMLNKEKKIGNNLLAEYFKNSLIIRSPPQALLFFKPLIACITSSSEITLFSSTFKELIFSTSR